MYTLTAALFVQLIIEANSRAQTSGEVQPAYASLNRYIIEEQAKTRMPAVSVALIESGGVVFLRGYGKANAKGDPVTANTTFQIASLSKSITALCILQLVEEELVALDVPVITYLPYFRTHDKSVSDTITLRHLLMHRSGLLTRYGNQYQTNQSRASNALQQLTNNLSDVRLSFLPGTAFEYSNANYGVLGDLLEQIEGRPFEDIVRLRVFEPLGMTNSYIQIPATKTVQEAAGFRRWFGFNVEQTFVAGRMNGPSGGVVSSAEDVGKYIAAMSNPETDLISDRLREALFDSLPAWDNTDYGLGWGLNRTARGTFIFHEGLNSGFKSVAGFNADTGEGVVVLTNRSSSLGDNFALSIMDAAMKEEPRQHLPSAVSVITLSGIAIVAFCMCVGAFWQMFRIYAHRNKAHGKGPLRRSLNLAFAIFLLGIAYILSVFVPSLNNVTLPVIYLFYPDLAFCLGLGAIAAMVWGLLLGADLIYNKRTG